LDLIGLISDNTAVNALADAMEKGGEVCASGLVGSSGSLVAAAVSRRTGRPVVLVVAHVDDAGEACDELESLGVSAVHFPALEVLPGETNVSLDLSAQRLFAVRSAAEVAASEQATVVVASIHALMQAVPTPANLSSLCRTIATGDELAPTDLVRWLDGAGYSRVDAVEEPGDFAMRGGILDVFPPGTSDPSQPARLGPIRLDYFGDEIEKITEIDLDTMGSGRTLDHAELVSARLDATGEDNDTTCYLDILPDNAVAILAETLEVTEQGRGYYERASDASGLYSPQDIFKRMHDGFHAFCEMNQFSLPASRDVQEIALGVLPLPQIADETGEAIEELAGLAKGGTRVIVSCQNVGERSRLAELLEERSASRDVTPIDAYVHRGFLLGKAGEQTAIVPYHELLHRYHTLRRKARLSPGRAMDTFLEFAEGDFVVHAEHGIARFKGISLIKPRRGKGTASDNDKVQEAQEYLLLEFAGRSRLHVPAINIDQVQKYIGGFKGVPKLSTLGGQAWKKQKQKVAESVKDLAAQLLRVRAARQSMPGIRFANDTPWQREFEDEFPYDETEDQLAAMGAIKRDMQHEQPMDRLLCGDVGFGKTELAIRAAFKAVEFGKQVAILVPTTVLAEQHERTFRERFAGYPFRIESLSRFKTGKEINSTLAALRKGHIDIIIGTHRLISKDVKFADLGLVVIDEEQRFGVEHKERLLQLRLTADILTLSATPIPRTLHMSLLGLRDISSLSTPPLDRQAVVTEVIPWDRARLEQAIARELSRDGQVFYVHNRVHDIRSTADDVQKLAPGARIVIGHGQMPPRELERVMLTFMRKEADILVSTTIIESGIDIPTANTMIIDDADRFGLADLHQLRGRVGRYKHRAYCYMLLPLTRTLRDVAKKRLKAIEQYSMLGAGFKIAMRDLEIRGAGNLLGPEQSGHIAVVGYEMYCRLLEDAVKTLQSESTALPSQTSIEIGLSGSIPKVYIPSDARRMDAYRRLAQAATTDELNKVEVDLTDAYGTAPSSVRTLFDLAEVRIAAAMLGVKSISIRGKDVLFRTLETDPVAQRLRGSGPGEANGFSVTALPPPSKSEDVDEPLSEVYFRPPSNYLEPATLVAVLRKRLG
jgi:transcription-repair coupling factor (superfamily II helicase)